MKTIYYKDYYTIVSYSAPDEVYYGKIEGIHDYVNFECSSIEEVEVAFREAVDDYLAFCEDINCPPEKPMESRSSATVSTELVPA